MKVDDFFKDHEDIVLILNDGHIYVEIVGTLEEWQELRKTLAEGPHDIYTEEKGWGDKKDE